MTDSGTLSPLGDFATLLATLKGRIRSAQLCAAAAVNQSLILLYWSTGRDIIARDLRRDFPEMTGLSPRNLAYMRVCAAVYPDRQIAQQAVIQIASGHNLRLKDFLKLADQRLWRGRQVIKHGWSRAVIAFGAALVQR